ncbi:unnamed protein product [marine sediment metagenome]|jgi:prevent-host-death family protein|uniref:Antitoxin n=1 Tax=marine sediment metagenome TaxID=412755 RepID=X0WHI1_9ZZZZ
MPRIGVRELKNRTSEVLRAVREEKAEYIVTYRGRAVARLVAIEEQRDEDIWAELERLRGEISAKWSSERPAAEVVSEGRR